MTFIFDTLFGSDKKINKKDFNRALKQISDISKEERNYLNEEFKSDLSDGLSAYELKQRIAKLKYKDGDCLDSWEVEQVKRKLVEEFKK